MSDTTPVTTFANPFSFGAPIPALLWESIEGAMRANMRNLAKDIAATLGQPDTLLLEALRSTTVKPYLFDECDQDKELDMRCSFLCQRPDAPSVIQRCQQPVFWSAASGTTPHTHRCTEHLYATPMPRPAGLTRLHPLEMDGLDTEDSSYSLFRTEDGSVVNGMGANRGRYDSDAKRLTLFVIEEDEEGKGSK